MENREKTHRKTACITGASGGIGEAFAKELAKKGYHLILVARNEAKLEAIAGRLQEAYGVTCETLVCDLNEKAACIRLMEDIRKQPIQLFINNAGFGDVSFFPEGDPDKEEQMINVNVKAVHFLTKAVVTEFLKRDRGCIVNVASIAGLMTGGPYMATYYATKSYVVSLTSAIAMELKQKKSRVRLYCLCPGPVNTDFNKVAGVKTPLKGISAEDCVRECFLQMRGNRIFLIPGMTTRVGAALVRLIPRAMQLQITAAIQKKKLG